MSQPLYVFIAVDVEEEGLFTGRYPRHSGVSNVAALPALAPLTVDCGIPLTLVCAHSAFADAAARQTLLHMRDTWGAELGAHLHYWSTPPHAAHDGAAMAPYVAARDVPTDILRAKLTGLFTAAAECCGKPVTTFRMGRWDMAQELWPLLEEQGIRVDSSIRPWHYPAGWRDHFLAPTAPYTVRVNGRDILEVPDTAVPLFPALAKACRAAPAPLLHRMHQWVVMTPNPVYHSLAYMKLAARLMLARGERVLSLTWHSSEVMAGATPHLPSQAHVDTVLARAKAFLHWLARQTEVRGVTLEQLGELARSGALAAAPLSREHMQLPGDWHPQVPA